MNNQKTKNNAAAHNSSEQHHYTAKQAREDRNKFYLYENHKNMCDDVLKEIKKIANNGGQGYILTKYSFSDAIIIGNALQPLGYSLLNYGSICWVAW